MDRKRIIVIGGGIGGYPSAICAARLGADVTLVEKEKIGGVCLNKGCIPTKVFLHTSSMIKEIKKAPRFGINPGALQVDFKRLSDRKREVVERLTEGVRRLLKNKKVRVVEGTASFIDLNRIKILETGEILTGDKFILATGSIPIHLSFEGIEDVPLLTSDDLLNIESLPRSLAIIGGGYIGVELGQFFNSMGVQVTILEMLNCIIPNEDEEVGRALESFLTQEGIHIYTQAKVEKVKKEGEHKRVIFSNPEGKKELLVSEVAQTVGRMPNYVKLDIEKIGLKTEKGRMKVNDRMETNIPHVYAVGDVIGGIMLAHVAMAEGECAARNALGFHSAVSYKAVPRCIYTSPEVACVGLTEKEAVQEKGEVQVSRFPFHAIGKAALTDEAEGMIKIIADKKYGEILGVHMVGPRVTELISEAVLAMEMEVTVNELAHLIHPHPTLSEGIREAAMMLTGGALHLP